VAVKGVLSSYDDVDKLPPAIRRDGVRVVVRDHGKCLDVLTSPSSSYLLPDLADFSLVKGEAMHAGFGRVMLGGAAVRVDRLSDQEDVVGLKAVLAAPSVALQPLNLFGFPNSTQIDSVRAIGLMTSSAAIATSLAAHPLEPIKAMVVEEFPHTTVATVEETPSLEPLRPDAPVADIASRIATLTDLGDEALGHLFKVERETFCRWRTGVLVNPRLGNRRRLGLLLTLLEDLAGRDVSIKDWLLNHTTVGGLTAYQLLGQGRIDDVAYLASSIGEPTTARDPRVASGQERKPLVFGEDDVWEPQVLDDER